VIVAVTDLDGDGANRLADSICKRGASAYALRIDVSSAVEVASAVEDVVQRHGRLDYIFNNAARAAVGEFRDGSVEDWRRVVDVNLFGVLHGAIAAYRVMLRQGFGHIVNVSSVTGLMPTPILSAYSTTKYAILGLSLSLREEAATFGVKVTAVCPGLVQTDIGERNIYWNVRKQDYLDWLPWRRWMMTPDEAAVAILRAVDRNQAIAVFPFSARVAWLAYRIYPRLFGPLLRRTLRDFRRLRVDSEKPL
jgi:NAD(P)-dependent dehydrogenase (short-subunit alcohol dehydrogenase family)